MHISYYYQVELYHYPRPARSQPRSGGKDLYDSVSVSVGGGPSVVPRFEFPEKRVLN